MLLNLQCFCVCVWGGGGGCHKVISQHVITKTYIFILGNFFLGGGGECTGLPSPYMRYGYVLIMISIPNRNVYTLGILKVNEARKFEWICAKG